MSLENPVSVEVLKSKVENLDLGPIPLKEIQQIPNTQKSDMKNTDLSKMSLKIQNIAGQNMKGVPISNHITLQNQYLEKHNPKNQHPKSKKVQKRGRHRRSKRKDIFGLQKENFNQ